jgi:hypothetical protein
MPENKRNSTLQHAADKALFVQVSQPGSRKKIPFRSRLKLAVSGNVLVSMVHAGQPKRKEHYIGHENAGCFARET